MVQCFKCTCEAVFQYVMLYKCEVYYPWKKIFALKDVEKSFHSGIPHFHFFKPLAVSLQITVGVSVGTFI